MGGFDHLTDVAAGSRGAHAAGHRRGRHGRRGDHAALSRRERPRRPPPPAAREEGSRRRLHRGRPGLRVHVPVNPRREVAMISVSIDLGAGRRGVDMGPSALRIAGLTEKVEALGYSVQEAGTGERRRLRDDRPGAARYARSWRRSWKSRRAGDMVTRGASRRGASRSSWGATTRSRSGRSRPWRGTTGAAGESIGDHLGRRPRRHEHAGDHAQRQRARHEPRRAGRPRPRGATALSGEVPAVRPET